MGNFRFTAAVTGGERVEAGYGGADGPRRYTIREKINLTAAMHSKTLVQRIPPRSKVSYCQLYNIDGISLSGTTGTATANRVGIIVSTVSAMATGTAGYGTVLFIGGTTTAAGTEYNGSPCINLAATTAPLTSGQWEYTSTSWGYIHIVPLSTSTVDPVAVATASVSTAAHFFFSTNTAATNTGAMAVQLTVETFPAIDVT